MVNKIFILIFGLLLINNLAFSQKFGYVNTDFILSQMTEYQDALKVLDGGADRLYAVVEGY